MPLHRDDSEYAKGLAAQTSKSDDRVSEAQRLGHSDKQAANHQSDDGLLTALGLLFQQLESLGFEQPTFVGIGASGKMTHPFAGVVADYSTGIVEIKADQEMTKRSVNVALAAMTHLANYRIKCASAKQSRYPVHTVPEQTRRRNDIESYTIYELMNELECRTWGKDNITRMNRLVQDKLIRAMCGDSKA